MSFLRLMMIKINACCTSLWQVVSLFASVALIYIYICTHKNVLAVCLAASVTFTYKPSNFRGLDTGNEHGLSALLEFCPMVCCFLGVWSDCIYWLLVSPHPPSPFPHPNPERKWGHVHISNLSVSCHVLSAGQQTQHPTTPTSPLSSHIPPSCFPRKSPGSPMGGGGGA